MNEPQKPTYLITVHDEEGNTIASGEASSAAGAIDEICRIHRYLQDLQEETNARPVIEQTT